MRNLTLLKPPEAGAKINPDTVSYKTLGKKTPSGVVLEGLRAHAYNDAWGGQRAFLASETNVHLYTGGCFGMFGYVAGKWAAATFPFLHRSVVALPQYFQTNGRERVAAWWDAMFDPEISPYRSILGAVTGYYKMLDGVPIYVGLVVNDMTVSSRMLMNFVMALRAPYYYPLSYHAFANFLDLGWTPKKALAASLTWTFSTVSDDKQKKDGLPVIRFQPHYANGYGASFTGQRENHRLDIQRLIDGNPNLEGAEAQLGDNRVYTPSAALWGSRVDKGSSINAVSAEISAVVNPLAKTEYRTIWGDRQAVVIQPSIMEHATDVFQKIYHDDPRV